MKVAGYCRVSTDKEDQANSFEAQQRYFREYVASQPGWELFEIYADEGITGTSTLKRTQFNRMINDAYEGNFQMILTKEVSRFSRNVLDTIAYTRELKAIGIGVIFMTDRINTLDPEGEMLLSFLASMAQEESRKTSTRVVWGQTRQMERGVVFGRSLLGYDVKDGQLHINPEGAELVRLIFHKYALEQVSTARIARFLSEAGYRTYRGSATWKSGTVIKILKNEKYVGDLVQKKSYTPDYLTHQKRSNAGQVPMITIENHHEPIISRDVWNLTRERLQRNNKHTSDTGHSNRYVFSGRIKCGECGASFIGRQKHRKDGSKLRRWCCATAEREGRDVCGIGKLVRDDDAMQMLKTAVNHLSLDFGSVINDVTELAMEAVLAGRREIRDDPGQLCCEIQRTQQKKEAVMDSYFAGEISREDMQAMKARYEQQMAELSRRMEEAERRKEENQDTAALRERIRREVSGILSGDIPSEVFGKTILDSLTVFKDRHMELRLKGLPHVFHFAG